MLDLLIVAGMVCAACAGNILLKVGSSSLDGGFAGLFNWKVIVGLVLFATAAIFYLFLLKRMPLNVAQSYMALQFIGVILGSYVILHEPLPLIRVAGVILIAVGIVLVGFSHSPK